LIREQQGTGVMTVVLEATGLQLQWPHFRSDEVQSSFSDGCRGMELSRWQQFVYGVLDGEEIGWLFDDYIYGRTIIWRITGTHQHGRGWGPHFDDVRHFSARHARHGIVGQDQIVKGGIKTVKRLAGGICTIHLISKIIEKQLGQQTDINIIINEQHGS